MAFTKVPATLLSVYLQLRPIQFKWQEKSKKNKSLFWGTILMKELIRSVAKGQYCRK